MGKKMNAFCRSEVFHNLVRSAGAVSGLLIVVFFLVMVLLGPAWTPQNPYDIASLDLMDAYKPPLWMEGGDPAFVLGTDEQGRDLLSAIVYGNRISLFIGVAVVLFSCVICTFFGLIAGYFGGRIDSILMRVVDIQLSFPAMLVALFIMAAFGR